MGFVYILTDVLQEHGAGNQRLIKIKNSENTTIITCYMMR